MYNIRNFHPLEVVGRGSEAKSHVGKNLNNITGRGGTVIMIDVHEVYTH